VTSFESCGELTAPVAVTARSRGLWIYFKTDARNAATGFSLPYVTYNGRTWLHVQWRRQKSEFRGPLSSPFPSFSFSFTFFLYPPFSTLSFFFSLSFSSYSFFFFILPSLFHRFLLLNFLHSSLFLPISIPLLPLKVGPQNPAREPGKAL